jgi:hypothetical protein
MPYSSSLLSFCSKFRGKPFETRLVVERIFVYMRARGQRKRVILTSVLMRIIYADPAELGA